MDNQPDKNCKKCKGQGITDFTVGIKGRNIPDFNVCECVKPVEKMEATTQ